MEETSGTEVERLRARVQELEAELRTVEGRRKPASPGEPHRRSRGWAATSAVLIVLSCFLAPLSVVSVWADTIVSDTDQYVKTVAPLADNPDVQGAVADEVTTVILQYVKVDEVTTEVLDSLASRPDVPPRVAAALPALSGPLTQGIESFTRDRITTFVSSDRFAQLWDQVNRTAHAQLVRLLSGESSGAVTAQGDTVTLNLGPIIDEVRKQLVDSGFTLAENIPQVDRSFVLMQSDSVTKAQRAYRLLDALGVWLPVVALGSFMAGVLIAADRRRALFRGALGLLSVMLLAGVGLAIFRATYVASTPADVLTPQAAGDVFDTLVRFLRTGIRSVAVLAIVLVLIAVLTGPSSAARSTRSVLTHGIGRLRGQAESAGWSSGRFGVWTYAHRSLLRVLTMIAGGLVLLFWDRPTGATVIGTAVVVGLVVALIEFLGRPPSPQPAGGTHPDVRPPDADPDVQPPEAQRLGVPPPEARQPAAPGAGQQRGDTL